MHTSPHHLAGQTVKLKEGLKHPQIDIDGADYRIEDWWDHLTGGSWMMADGNPAAMVYAIRTGMMGADGPPLNDDVLYGKVDGLGHLIHVSEIVDPSEAPIEPDAIEQPVSEEAPVDA